MAEKHPPIGTISAYAGNFAPNLGTWEDDNGWLLCDGRPLNRTDNKYKKLFDAIGSSWGGDGANTFNLPDLFGYFLRGVSGNSGRDPNIEERTASKPGGHIKNDVGSIQMDAMQSHKHGEHGLAHTHSGNTNTDGGHSHPVNIHRENISGSNRTHDVDGSDEKWNSDPNLGSITASIPANTGQHSHQFTTGHPNNNLTIGEPTDSGTGIGPARHGRETRPMNAYVHWIIRYK